MSSFNKCKFCGGVVAIDGVCCSCYKQNWHCRVVETDNANEEPTMKTIHEPKSTEELEEVIETEIHAKPQLNTQRMVRVETRSGRRIPGVYSLEAWLQKGFVVKFDIGDLITLIRPYSPTDCDTLIAHCV